MPFRRPITVFVLGIVLLLFEIVYPRSHWRKVDAGFQGQINGVAMSPDGRHIVLSGGFCRHSSDRGITWESVGSCPDIMVFGDNAHLFATGFTQGCNLPNGYADIERSSDYGKSWNITIVRPPMCFSDIFFIDSLHGWSVGSNKDSIVITKDGGRTLTTRSYGLPNYFAAGVVFIDSLRGWVVGGLQGTDTAVMATTDGGNSWTHYSFGIPFFSARYIDFVDSLHGWLDAKCIFHTTDAGRSWVNQGTFCYFGGVIRSVQAVDSLHVWVFGDYFAPFIWKTTDGGQTWTLEYNGPGSSILDATMVDSSRGVAAGGNGMVLIYTPLILGDLNADEQVSFLDIAFELNRVFLEQAFPSPLEAGDTNCDGLFSAADVVLLLFRVFRDTPFPCSI